MNMNNRIKFYSIIAVIWVFSSIVPMVSVNSSYATYFTTFFGNTWIVDQSGGGDFTSIQDAIDVSSNGDLIIINDGVYNEILTIDKSIRVNGNNIDNTILKGSDVGNGITITVNDVQISNITITNFEKGIYSQDHQYLNISYIKISYCTDGISFIKCNYNVVKHSIICNYYGIGMSLDECSNNEVINCRLFNSTSAGIYFRGLPRSFKGNTIKNNHINNTYGGIATTGDDTTISNNTIHDTYYGISVRYGLNNLIYNNTIMKVRDGIRYESTLSTFHNISIKNCYYGIYSTSGDREFYTHFDHITIENASSNGIFLDGSQHNITNSKIKNCTNNGIYIEGHFHSLIENITIEDAKIGIDLHNGFEYRFKNNKIGNCDTGISLSEERNRDNG